MPLDFVRHESQQNLILWLFYGIVAGMALYNLGTAALLRRREYIYYLSLLIAMAAGIFTLSGQTFQYVLPNHPALANRALAVCLAVGMLCIQLYGRELVSQVGERVALDKLRRSFTYTLPPCAPIVAVALFAPHPYAQLGVFAGLLFYLPVAVYQLFLTLRAGVPHLRLYVLSFSLVSVCIPIALLAHVKIIPPYTLAIWAGHIGCAAYSILTSLSLPMRVADLGSRLAGVNQQLSDNVADLKQALARAERATKVKDEFIATMSHELRTPLNAIINVPQGLLADFETVPAAVCTSCKGEFLLDPGETIEAHTACPSCGAPRTLRAETSTVYVGRPAHTVRFLRKIERSGHHLLQMVNGVLDFSKMAAGRLELSLEAVDLRLFLSEVVDQMNDMAQGRGISIALTTTDASDPCFVDPVRLRQVLMNLLANAIKFSDPGSTLRVNWERDGDADHIEVIDRGIGIAAENHERIFASFEQVHKGDTRKYGGTGLGLSISRSLVRMHGGELWVESKLGAGSTFKLTIPRNLEQSSETSMVASKVA
jgi:signal transduction histidine kinase